MENKTNKTAEEKAMELFPHVSGDKSSENFTKYHVWLAGHRYAKQNKVYRLYPEDNILDLAISKIEEQKFNLHVSKLPATKVGLTDAIGVLHFLKEEYFIECECGHEVEHKFTRTNEDGQVTCLPCTIEEISQQSKEKDEEIKRLRKALTELVADLKADRYNHRLATMEKVNKALNQ